MAKERAVMIRMLLESVSISASVSISLTSAKLKKMSFSLCFRVQRRSYLKMLECKRDCTEFGS